MWDFIKRRWKFYLTAIICLELFVTFAGCASSLLLFPSTEPRQLLGAQRRMVEIDGKTLELFTKRSPACQGAEPKAFVLEFCGNGTRAEDITAWLADQRWRHWPVEVWCLNYPGYGRSAGPATLKSIPPAALASYDELRKTAGQRPIFLESNSIGGASLLYVASRRKTPAVILQNPPPLKRLILQRHGWWNLWLLATPVALQIPWQLNTPDTAPAVKVPALFLLADSDEIIPPKYHDIVVNAYGGPKTVINLPYATHNSPIDAESEKKARQWIDAIWKQTFPDKPTTQDPATP